MADEFDAPAIRRWFEEYARLIETNASVLTDLDAAIGDADHGTNMQRGMAAVRAALAAADDAVGPAQLLKSAAMTLISSVGGASGPLYGTLLLRMATAAGEVTCLDADSFARALRAGVDGVVSRGRASRGDKTMCDALAPACDALDAALAAGANLESALASAARAAGSGRDETTPMIARKGRASYLGERSAGHQDPGATSAALLVTAAHTAIAGG